MNDGVNPFEGLPMFGEMARALSGQGPLNWDLARQFATLSVADPSVAGGSEPNVDPLARIRLAELARIVELHVADITGTDVTFPEVVPVTRAAWAQRTLDDYRPLFTELATSLGRRDDESPTDPMAAMMANLAGLMAPAMMGMAVGSMVGRLAVRSFGQYDLPIPRGGSGISVVAANIDAFAAEWELSVDEMRLWVLAQELTAHSLFSAAALRDEFTALVRRYVSGFRPDPDAVGERLADLQGADAADPSAAMQRLLGDPALLLGAVQSAEQAALAPTLDAAVAGVVGYVDSLVDSVAVRVIGGDALRIAEAIRRRRVEASPDQVFVERLLGMRITNDQVQRGKLFVGGVIDRVGERRLSELFHRRSALPTPAEIDAPGLWIARVEVAD